MGGCSIRNCKSRSVKGGAIMFFSFPTKESVAKEWLRYCKPKTKTKNGRVCSKHFLPSDYIVTLKHILMNDTPRRSRKIKPDAIPSLHIANTDIPEAIYTLEISNIPIDKPEALHILETEPNDTDIPDTLPSPQSDDVETKNISFVSIDIPSYACSSGNMKCSPGECNTTPANDIAGSSKVVGKSDEVIAIPLAEHKQLQKTAKRFNVLKQNLDKIFTSGQVRCLMKPNMRRVRWSDEDIAAAISLRNISPQGYRHLRVAIGIPLPAVSTLRHWASKSGPGRKKSLDVKHKRRKSSVPNVGVATVAATNATASAVSSVDVATAAATTNATAAVVPSVGATTAAATNATLAAVPRVVVVTAAAVNANHFLLPWRNSFAKCTTAGVPGVGVTTAAVTNATAAAIPDVGATTVAATNATATPVPSVRVATAAAATKAALAAVPRVSIATATATKATLAAVPRVGVATATATKVTLAAVPRVGVATATATKATLAAVPRVVVVTAAAINAKHFPLPWRKSSATCTTTAGVGVATSAVTNGTATSVPILTSPPQQPPTLPQLQSPVLASPLQQPPLTLPQLQSPVLASPLQQPPPTLPQLRSPVSASPVQQPPPQITTRSHDELVQRILDYSNGPAE